METAKSELHIAFLELGWEDTTSWSIPDEDLVRCVRFIHAARRAGGSVLVHCAQVRRTEFLLPQTNVVMTDSECSSFIYQSSS